jgi:hypothetical protein
VTFTFFDKSRFVAFPVMLFKTGPAADRTHCSPRTTAVPAFRIYPGIIKTTLPALFVHITNIKHLSLTPFLIFGYGYEILVVL